MPGDPKPMKLPVVALALCAVTLTGTAGMARSKGPPMRDQAQAACYDDAQRLCGQFMPNEAKVVACMKPKKAEVSPKCAVFYGKNL